jgi:hypothetical protein
VYGTGKDRQWIPSDGPKHKVHHTTPAAATSSAPGAGSTSASGAGTSSTGGTAAPAA